MYQFRQPAVAFTLLICILMVSGCDIWGDDESGELIIEDLVVGEGALAEASSLVTVHYIGRLQNGQVFDNSRERGSPFQFTIGAGRVIPGWEIGVEGMREGGTRRLTIPPHLAYGRQGIRDQFTGMFVIPPNATLTFDIELLDVE